jgi:hypothetical protein
LYQDEQVEGLFGGVMRSLARSGLDLGSRRAKGRVTRMFGKPLRHDAAVAARPVTRGKPERPPVRLRGE